MNKRFTVEESNLISIFMEECIDSDVGGRKKVINGIDKALKHLEDDLGSDVGHDAQAEDGHARKGAAREQVEHRHGTARGDAGRIRAQHLLERGARHGKVRTEAVENENPHGEENLLPQFRHSESVGDSV